MAVKVLGAGVQLADDCRGNFDPLRPFACSRPKAGPSDYSLDFALNACDRAISQSSLTPDQIDLIISMSISPSHLVKQSQICGPRLGNPVQRELQADNAYVFDLLAADWVFAIDAAHNFCSQMGWSTALLVRAEASAMGMAGDSDSGFDIVDGGGVLLLQINSENDGSGMMQYQSLNSGYLPASVRILDHKDGKNKFRCALNLPVQPDLNSSVNDAMTDLLGNLERENSSFDSVIYEKWFPGDRLDPVKTPLINAKDDDQYYAAFDIPLGLQIARTKTIKQQVALLTFDPFSGRVGGLTVGL